MDIPGALRMQIGDSMEQKNGLLGKVFGFINKAGVVVMINVLFLVMAIALPLVYFVWVLPAMNNGTVAQLLLGLSIAPMGLAWSGLFSAVRYMIRKDSWFDGFKAGVRINWVRKLVAWFLGALLASFTLPNAYAGIRHIIEGNPVTVGGVIIPLTVDCLFTLVAVLVLTALVPTGVYFETDANDWVSNAWYLILHAPLQVILTAAMMWAPFVLVFVSPIWSFLLLLIFICAYFVLITFISTILLKNPLIRILRRIRGEDEEG